MQQQIFNNREVRAFAILNAIVVCGLASCLICASKVVHIGIDFPCSNIIFAIFTYPVVDCICELWGKQAARQTLYFALGSQLFIAALIQLSIALPHSALWLWQDQYELVLSSSGKVIIAGIIAFSLSQMLDIYVYQRIKELTKGKWLWLRSNISTYLGQALDSLIIVMIVFADSDHKLAILLGSITVKIILSFLMTPFVYLIVITVNKYLDSKTLAFKDEALMDPELQASFSQR